MTGTINSIYFTKDGIIPAYILDNLREMATEAKNAGYSVHFWSDISILQAEIKEVFSEQGIVIHDYQEVKQPLVDVIHKFVRQGHAGDICSYAMASDFLRVAIAEIIPNDDIYIYVDCNDNFFLKPDIDLQKLASDFLKNPWGLSFPITVLLRDLVGNVEAGEIRNDCVIIRKSNNLIFFENFFAEYIKRVQERALSYQVTDDSRLKKKQADEISCFVSSIPFEITTSGKIRMARNNNFMEDINVIAFSTYIESERRPQLGNTWRMQEEDYLDEFELEYEAALNRTNSSNRLNSDEYRLYAYQRLGLLPNMNATSASKKHPFEEYELNALYQLNDDSFVLRDYPNSLLKVEYYGTDKVNYINQQYDANTKKINTFCIEENEVLDFIKSIEQHLQQPKFRRNNS